VVESGNSERQLTEKDLRQWDLLRTFEAVLARQDAAGRQHPSWADARRTCAHGQYLSLFLFALFNPVLKTMRAVCAASQLPRVQREVSGGPVSLGSFSEAQHLTDPAVLERVFGELAGQVQGPCPGDVRPAWRQWFARDSSLFAALPRMNWALYGGGRAGAKNNAVRLHLNFHLLDDKPARMQVVPGKVCERKVWREVWERGAGYVGDRYFAEGYALLGQLEEKGCRYVLRLRDEALITVEEELPLEEADRAANVQRQGWARLGGKAHRSVRVRVVWLRTAQGEELRLITNVPADQLSAAEVGLLYRRRWQVECFFRWVKCLLGCRHWLAESQTGVTLQLYLALIAAVLFQLHTGRRPNKRMLELFQLHQLGWASTEDLLAALAREQQREQRRKAKTK
jgi:hypothetical protein